MNKSYSIFSLFLLFLNLLVAQPKKEIDASFFIDFEKMESQKSQFNYSLTELINIMEDSIKEKGKVVIPEGATEFERVLCASRRIQHNDSQLVAIRALKTLLEFEYYRTRGEELYLKFLMGASLKYIGAPIIAYNYFEPIFPEILTEINDTALYSILLNNYAGLLISIDSLEKARDIYKLNLRLYSKNENKVEMYNSRNNLGFTHQLLNQYDSAKYYYLENQKPEHKNLTPVLYAFSFGNYGSVMLKENKPDSALYYMRKELDLLSKIPAEDGIYNTYHGMASAFELQENIDSAYHYYYLALEKSKEANNIEAITRNYQALINIYVLKENASELSSLTANFFKWNDSLKKMVNIKAVKDELQVSRSLNIFEETERSKRKTDLLEAKNRELTYTIIALGFIVLLLGVTLTVRQKNRSKLEAKNIELNEKNIELNESYSTISESNKRNEVLLRELHHRVKNNLQIINSLFNLQLNVSSLNETTRKVFQNAKNRVYSISLIHKKIYQSDNFNSLDFEQYIRDFSDEILKATQNDVDISIEIQRNPISIESAIPLGLIFNELFTNSLKHSKRHDLLEISIRYEDYGEKEKFIYSDNGVGLSNVEMMKESDTSIGVTLIHLLGEQLDAKIEYKEAVKDKHGFWLSIEGKFA